MITLDTRIRDAELSVRTSNGIRLLYGEDVTFRQVAGPEFQTIIAGRVGRKGLKEFNELLKYAGDGSDIEDTRDIPTPKPEVLTLRDQFAMSALIGLVGTPHLYAQNDNPTGAVTQHAYKIADAMMEARK